MNRNLKKIYKSKSNPGFLGNGHMARPVIQGDFSQTDPFIMLMDDVLDKKDSIPVGGPHPHAGFETVSLLLEGTMGEPPHQIKAGGLQVMTAGSGIVHTETIDQPEKMRLLQLWLTLPKEDRWTEPRLQDLPLSEVPVLNESGINIKVYSGNFAGLQSPILHHTPFILADIQLEPGVETHQVLPSNWTTFIYGIAGVVQVGDDGQEVGENHTGWLKRIPEQVESNLILKGGQNGGRIILYAGEPQKSRIVSYGPFIADTDEDIARLYKEYRQGKMKHVSTLPAGQVYVW